MININANTPNLIYSPPSSVVPPPAPPINPAPPGGARREARQRQAAAAKSEEGAQQARENGVDLAGDRPGGSDAAQMTRHTNPPAPLTRRDRVKPGQSITVLRHAGQPSAWSRDLLYGGGLGAAAIVLALGFSVLRPGPGRRRPTVPAAAWARVRGRR